VVGGFRAREQAKIGEVLLPEEDTMDLLELPAGRLPGRQAIRLFGTSGSCSGPGYTTLV
jgi:hypothetical protein